MVGDKYFWLLHRLVLLITYAGVSSSYQAGNPTNGRAAPSDLPQLTGEDLRMLDTFDQTRLPGEGNHFCGSAQPQLPPATLNYHGNVLM